MNYYRGFFAKERRPADGPGSAVKQAAPCHSFTLKRCPRGVNTSHCFLLIYGENAPATGIQGGQCNEKKLPLTHAVAPPSDPPASPSAPARTTPRAQPSPAESQPPRRSADRSNSIRKGSFACIASRPTPRPAQPLCPLPQAARPAQPPSS